MKRTIFVALGVIVLAGSALRAHHSYARFELDRTVSVEGELAKMLFANPHVVLTIRTKDGAVYTAEWSSAFQLNSIGVAPTTLKAGDTIIITGNPSRDPAAHQLARLTEVRRPKDGWSWGRVPTSNGKGWTPQVRNTE